MGKVIGIDLGTTNSVAAYVEGKNPEIILSPEGDRLLPSLVAFGKTGERLVGNPAKSQLITNVNTIYSVKRLIGKRYSEVAPYLDQFSYPIVEGEGDRLRIKIDELLFSPEEISAMILEKLKHAAEHRLGDKINGAIITVPAYFDDTQRQATKDAGEIAGLNVLRIINEPTAASLLFSMDLRRKSIVVVYDFGGGTIDFSILEVQNEVIKVLGTAGDINLGGIDFDVMLANQLVEFIKEEHHVDLSGDKLAMQRLRDAAENTKKELSAMEECEINLPFIADSDEGAVHFLRYYSRKEFEKLIKTKVDRTLEICSGALNRADLTIDQVDEILMVGGSTRIPYVQKRLKEYFRKDPNKKVNPDEIVAMGAAIQASIAAGDSKDILLLDVIPLALGVKTFGGVFTRVLDANTTIPTNRSLIFSTAEDNQEEVEINVYQGEREIAEDNKLLGKFTLTNIRKAPKGIARIEVSFSIDINGILTVTAIDLSTKSKKEVVVSNSGLLSENEIRQLKKSATKFKEDDIKKKEKIQIKNEIFNYVYMIKKYLDNPALEPEMVGVANGIIRSAGEAIDREIKEELDEVCEQLADLNSQLSRMVSQPIDTIETVNLDDDTGSLATQGAFEVHETLGASAIPASPPEPEPIPAPPVSKPAGNDSKETIELKQKILHAVYHMEQYLGNLSLDQVLVAECRYWVSRANKEIDTASMNELKDIDRELAEMNKKLDQEVGAALGLSPKDDGKEEPPAEESKFKKDDTKPFKIFKG